MEIGNMVKVKSGTSEWMKEKGFWLEIMPDNIDNMEGRIVNDYTNLVGNDSHFAVKFESIQCEIGIHPHWLNYKECDFCNNPYVWKVIDESGEMVRAQCKECGNEFTFKNYGRCSECGFFLDKDIWCEACEK